MPLASILARHRTSAAAATVLLAPRRASLAPEVKVGRAPSGVDYVGLDASRAQLCFCAASGDVRDVLRLPRATLRAAGAVALRTDLVDAQAYVLHASLLRVLAAKPAFTSLRRDLLLMPSLAYARDSRLPFERSSKPQPRPPRSARSSRRCAKSCSWPPRRLQAPPQCRSRAVRSKRRRRQRNRGWITMARTFESITAAATCHRTAPPGVGGCGALSGGGWGAAEGGGQRDPPSLCQDGSS